MKLTDAFGLPPALRHATTLESKTTLSPGIYRLLEPKHNHKYNVRPVEHDLDYLSKHGADDFYSDVRPFEVKHDFDFCKLGGAETVNYDLERQIRRYSSSKLRKMRKMHSSRSIS